MDDSRRTDHPYSIKCGHDKQSIALQILTGHAAPPLITVKNEKNETVLVSRTPPPAHNHSGLSPGRMGRSPSPGRPLSRSSLPARPSPLLHQEIMTIPGQAINLSRPNSRNQVSPAPPPHPHHMLLSQPQGIPILQAAGLICPPPSVLGGLPNQPLQLLQMAPNHPSSAAAFHNQLFSSHSSHATAPILSQHMSGGQVEMQKKVLPPKTRTAFEGDGRTILTVKPQHVSGNPRVTSQVLAQMLKTRNPELNSKVLDSEQKVERIDRQESHIRPVMNSRHGAVVTSEHHNETAVNNRQETAVNSRHETFVNSRHETAVNSRHEAAVNSRNETSVNSRHEAAVNSRHESSVNSRHEAAMNSRHETSVNSRHEASLHSRHETVLSTRPETMVKSRPEAMVNNRHDTVVNSRHDIVVNNRLDGGTIKPQISFSAEGLVQKPNLHQCLTEPAHSSLSHNHQLSIPPPHLIPVATPKYTTDVPRTNNRDRKGTVKCPSPLTSQKNYTGHSPENMPRLMPELTCISQSPLEDKKVSDMLADACDDKKLAPSFWSPLTKIKKEEPKKQEELQDDTTEILVNPYNMRVENLKNFTPGQTAYRTTYRSQSMAIHRAKAGSITNPARSLDIARQNLQKYINQEIDQIMQKYIEQFFRSSMENIKKNSGDVPVHDDNIQTVCCQILEEAKKMYVSDARSITPDLQDNLSECGSLPENKHIRATKINLFPGCGRKRRDSSGSDASQPRRKHKRGRPPLHGQNASGRNTPSKNKHEPIRKEGPKWDPSRLTTEALFVMGARANKALGLGATRGRLYIKHQDVFKYCGDQDDKSWLYESHHMPATGGKAYLLLVDDINELANSAEYKDTPGLLLDEIVGFTVPQWMVDKMKIQMQALRTDLPRTIKQRIQPVIPSSLLQDGDDVLTKLEISVAEGEDKLLIDNKEDVQSQCSPANTEPLDSLSLRDDEDDTPVVSPYNMTGGFAEVSPAPCSPSSDLDTLEDNSPISAPFQTQ